MLERVVNFQSQEIRKRTKIIHMNKGVKMLETINQSKLCPSDNNVININQKNNSCRCLAKE